MMFTPQRISTLIIIERVTASISVTATLLLIAAFIFIKELRTLSNTLIFYASFANIFANVAALIGGSALSNENGALCQFQGFLLQMFMQSDPMWSCAMAVNVYLVFFHRYDTHRLKRLYWIYGIICYGVPFIPAIFCLFYQTKEKGKMYGNATLWCWIDNDWAAIRIYSYYAPVWVAILFSLLIYLRVGIEIFQKRSELRAALGSNPKSANYDLNTVSPTSLTIPMPAFSGLRTTEVEVTSDHKHSLIPSPNSSSKLQHSKLKGIRGAEQKEAYTITISASHLPSSLPSPTTPSSSTYHTPTSSSYQTITHPPKRPGIDKIKYAYTRTALLFAISILITWVPASVNRVYGLTYPRNPSYALNIASAAVLPLQGFWNSVLFFGSSAGVLRVWWERWRDVSVRERGVGNGFVNLGVRQDGGRRKMELRERLKG